MNGILGTAASPPGQEQEHFQLRVRRWLLACFGRDIANNITERNHRFLEEALELVQTSGCTRSEAHQLVDYVFDRPVGEMGQELGGTMVTLAALCSVAGVDMELAAERELTRVWTAIDKIRSKQAAKPKHSPLAAAPPAQGWQPLEHLLKTYELQEQAARSTIGFGGLTEIDNAYYRGKADGIKQARESIGLLPAPPLAAQEKPNPEG